MTVSVDAVVYYRIFEPMMSVVNIVNASKSTRLLSQTTLRNFLGKKTLSEILTDRDQITEAMQVTGRVGIGARYLGFKKYVMLPQRGLRLCSLYCERYLTHFLTHSRWVVFHTGLSFLYFLLTWRSLGLLHARFCIFC